MKKNIKVVIGITLGIVIGTSTIVGATTIFRSEDITYSSPTNKTNVKDSLDELYEKSKTLADIVEKGDYISMTPTSTSYTPPSTLTGCSEDDCIQGTLNPSELNLWRVTGIDDNSGVVSIMSEYVSSTPVTFKGKIGYVSYVHALEEISKAYWNSKYVVKPLCAGCDFISGVIADQSKINSDTKPFNTSTQGEPSWWHCDEGRLCNTFSDLGGGDSHNAYFVWYFGGENNLVKTDPSGVTRSYFVPSRYYRHSTEFELSDSSSTVGWCFMGRFMNTSGSFSAEPLICRNTSNTEEKELTHYILPELVLSPNCKISSGDGKSASTAYQLN